MTSLPPFDPDNPDPEPFQVVNELHRQGASLGAFRLALTRLRATNREAYIKLVAAVRETQ